VNNLSTHPFHLDAVAHAGLGLAAGLGSAFFAVIAVRLGASPWLLALITSAPYLTNLLAPAWAGQSRRFGTRWLVVVSLATAAIVLLLLGMAHSPLSFALLVMLYYLFYGVSDPLYVAMAEVVYPERTGTSLGRVGAIFNSTRTLAAGVAGWLMDTWGMRLAAAIAALSTGVAAAAYVPFPDVPQREADDETSPWHFVRQDSILRQMLLVFMVAGTGMVMMLPALPLVEVAQLQLSNTQIGLLLAVNGLALILASGVWGHLGEKPERSTALLQWGMVFIVGMTLLYAFSGSFTALLIANFLCGIGGAAISVGWRLFAIHLATYETVDLAGLHLFTCGLRGLYAPALGAVLINLWNTTATLVIAAVLIVAGIFMLSLSPFKAPRAVTSNGVEAEIRKTG